MALKVGVLMGGWSPEKKISLMSGKNVVEGLRKAGLKAVPFVLTTADKNEKKFETRLKKAKFDVVFIALHGGFGEDGTLQGLLDQWGIAYTGSGALACGLAMHKGCSKLVFEAQGIPSALWHALHKTTEPKNWHKEIKLALPLVVKPADVGSSTGITIVKKKTQLTKAIKLAFKHSDWAMVEKFIPGTEVTVAVLGGNALPVIEIVPKGEFYDFNSKYKPGQSIHISPARIGPVQTKRVKELAIKAGKAMGCEDYYRADFIVPKKGEPQILEINAVPGMTSTSLVPDAARSVGITFPALLKTLVGMALKKKEKKA
ncbi:MAG TPA: D-alanine--D-alanine ligase [bacterium]|jgi:D-alanine-D-alanine ligase|nr:D-alanine--D-alanine ligase [bacterium]